MKYNLAIRRAAFSAKKNVLFFSFKKYSSMPSSFVKGCVVTHLFFIIIKTLRK
jgi:hypothetical protein